jgi:hypothetical protein
MGGNSSLQWRPLPTLIMWTHPFGSTSILAFNFKERKLIILPSIAFLKNNPIFEKFPDNYFVFPLI